MKCATSSRVSRNTCTPRLPGVARSCFTPGPSRYAAYSSAIPARVRPCHILATARFPIFFAVLPVVLLCLQDPGREQARDTGVARVGIELYRVDGEPPGRLVKLRGVEHGGAAD